MTEPSVLDAEPLAAASMFGDDRTRVRVIAIALCAVAVLGIGLFAAWERGRDSGPPAYVELAVPVQLPDVELTDTSGASYRLADEAAGRTTLLFFGYLNCPDACPTQMAVLGRVFHDLPNDVRDRIDVVFVTTDPQRDSPADMRAYLDNFDTRFIGLTGSDQALADAQIAAGVPVAVVEPPSMSDGYLVGHATQVLVFGSDGLAYRAYPFGVRQSDWLHDLPQLVAQEAAG